MLPQNDTINTSKKIPCHPYPRNVILNTCIVILSAAKNLYQDSSVATILIVLSHQNDRVLASKHYHVSS